MSPYISPPRREAFAQFRQAVKSTRLDTTGELTYLICWVCDQYLRQHPEDYQHMNDVMGALSCAGHEFYRRIVAILEDRKAAENGDVWKQEDK